MQSSSKLFPVALVSAELRGDLIEDVYLLKPNNSPDPSVELALTRLGRAGSAARGIPVVLLHDRFGNRRSWYTPAGQGLGARLARAGFDVWLAEMRGHGLSPRNRSYRDNRVADYARYDLPAIAAFVGEQCGRAAHWLGAGHGGLALVAALAMEALDGAALASLVLYAAQLHRPAGRLGLPPLRWAAGLWLRRRQQVAAGWLGLEAGPEEEPVGVLRESLCWSGWFGRFGEGGQDWLARLGDVRVPVLALVGAGARPAVVGAARQLLERFASPLREFVRLDREPGVAGDDPGKALCGTDCTELAGLLSGWLERPAPLSVRGCESPTFA